jgi:hypothetical protein
MRAQVEAAQQALVAQQATTAEALAEAAGARERAEAAERLAQESAQAVSAVQVSMCTACCSLVLHQYMHQDHMSVAGTVGSLIPRGNKLLQMARIP